MKNRFMRQLISLLLAAVLLAGMPGSDSLCLAAYAAETSGTAEADSQDDTDTASADASGTDSSEADAAADESAENTDTEDTEDTVLCTDTCVPEADDLPDNDELFAEYFEEVLYEEVEETSEEADDAGEDSDDTQAIDELLSDSVSDAAAASAYGETYFSNDEACLSLYTQLKEAVAQIAADGGSTEITIGTPVSFTYYNTDGEDADTFAASAKEAFKEDFGEVLDCLLADSPYELYWYDKVTGTSYQYYPTTGSETCTFMIGNAAVIKMYVASSYQGTDSEGNTSSLIVDPDTAAAAAETVEAAQEVVSEYASYDDYNKLTAYKEWICDAVSYYSDYSTYYTENGYGDPWQIIWVFDGDEDTNVVCEGYSKAFQYLCDLSAFEEDLTDCYTVTGTLNGGGHMWNIVRMDDGDYYLVDVTNSDTGTAGSHGGLFLAGNDSGSADSGYTFALSGTYTSDGVEYSYSSTVTYIYYDDTISLYGDILTLAASDYVHHNWDEGTVTAEATCTQDGEILYTCSDSDCGMTKTVVIAATGHSYENNICSTCGALKSSSVSSASVTLSYTSAVYTGSALQPSVTAVTVNGTTLKSGTDYTVSYSNNTSVGTAAVIVTGSGSYSGSISKTFTITAQTLSSSKVTLSYTSKTYTGAVFSPTVTVKNASGTTLIEGTDYTVTTPSGRKNAGTYTYTIRGTGNYTGTVSKTLAVNAVSIKKSSSAYVSCTLSKTSYTYSGSERKPSVTLKVKVNGSTKTLSKSSSSGYTVTYKNNKAIGKATVTITGTGNYTGTITKTFKILPKKVSLKSSSTKSSSKKKLTVAWSKSSGGVKYQIAYRKKGSSTWKYKTAGSSTYKKTLTGLTSGKSYYVKVRAYKKVSGTTYYGSWSATKTVRVK